MLSASHRSRIRGQPAESSSPGVDLEQESRAGQWPLWRSAAVLGDVFDHLAGILVQHGIMLHDQEAVVILLKDGHELEAGERSAHIKLCDIAIQLDDVFSSCREDEIGSDRLRFIEGKFMVLFTSRVNDPL